MSTRPSFVLNEESARAIILKRGKAGIVTGEGKITAKVSSVVPYTRNKGTDKEQKVMIVNLHLMSEYHYTKSLKAFASGDYTAAVGSGTSFSASVLEGQYVPRKGENVNVQIEEIFSKKQETNILVVGAIFETAQMAVKDGSSDAFDKNLAALQAQPVQVEATNKALEESVL